MQNRIPILKILKIYLVFIIAITIFSSFGSNDAMKYNLSSVAHSTNLFSLSGKEDQVSSAFIKVQNPEYFDFQEDVKYQFNENKNQNIHIEITNPLNKGFAAKGSTLAEVANIKVKANEQLVSFKHLKLKIEEVNLDLIKNAYLFKGEKPLSEAEIIDEYIVFSKINKDIKNQEVNLTLKIDLSEELKSGDRLHFKIENPSDAGFFINEEQYSIAGYYPLQIASLSVVR